MNTKHVLLAALLLPLLISSCGLKSGTGAPSAIDLRYPQTHYILPTPETVRFREEATRAKRAGNREVCGTLLLSESGSLALCFADNDSQSAHSFSISHASLRRMKEVASRTNSAIIGSFHSHPSGIAEPGEADLHGEAVNNLLMIHSCLTNKTRLWRISVIDGERSAVEVPVMVQSRRVRSASPLAPSRSVRGLARDVRTHHRGPGRHWRDGWSATPKATSRPPTRSWRWFGLFGGRQ